MGRYRGRVLLFPHPTSDVVIEADGFMTEIISPHQRWPARVSLVMGSGTRYYGKQVD